MQSFTITLPEEVSNKVERAYYESESAARNVAFALSKDQTKEVYSSAYGRYWERLVTFSTEYAMCKNMISNDYVMPELKNRGITAMTQWNLDYSTRIITVTYDENAENEKRETFEIDCPEMFSDATSNAGKSLNAYDTLLEYIYRNEGVISPQQWDELDNKRTEAFKEFSIARNAVETNVVMPTLQQKNITERVDWSLDYGTRVITISYVPGKN